LVNQLSTIELNQLAQNDSREGCTSVVEAPALAPGDLQKAPFQIPHLLSKVEFNQTGSGQTGRKAIPCRGRKGHVKRAPPCSHSYRAQATDIRVARKDMLLIKPVEVPRARVLKAVRAVGLRRWDRRAWRVALLWLDVERLPRLAPCNHHDRPIDRPSRFRSCVCRYRYRYRQEARSRYYTGSVSEFAFEGVCA
jgi:hypothetical protein